MAYIGNKPPAVSNLITDIKIGEDDETKIDFADANTINFHANNSKEMVLVENALTPGTSDGIALGTTSLMWSDLFLASGGVMNFNNGNVTITHTNGTGLTINSTNKLMFGDSASFIQQSADGTLKIDGEAIIDLNASTRVDVSGDLKVGSNIELGNASDTTLARSAAGEVTIEGSLIKKAGVENIWVPAQAMTPRDNAGCADLSTVAAGTNGRPDFHVLDFDKDSDEHAQFSIAMPKSWDGGNVNAYFYWIGIAATTGVAWGTQVLSLNDNEEIDAPYGTAVITQDDSQGDATELLISAKSGDIACSGADGDLLYFQVFRDVSDGNDDMAGDARLVGILFEYTSSASTDG